MSTAEWLQWVALITVVEPREVEENKSNPQGSF
jgi:hypothetical protein